MKKIFMIFVILFLTGCSNNLICTMQTEEKNYITDKKITFEFDKNDKVNDVVASYTMTFEVEEDAKEYAAIFETLEGDYEVKIDGKKLNVVTKKNYTEYNETKKQIKEEFKKNGYSCK